jgi:hypothetical protein
MSWLRRIRGAIGMGVTWAIAWGLFGLLIGLTSFVTPFLPWDTFFRYFDAPLPALAVPGFFGGMIFSVVLGVVARNRRFNELSMKKFAAWGALGGALLSVVPATMVTLGIATPAPWLNIWLATAVIAPPLMLLGAGSAAGSLAIARKGESRIGAGDAAAMVADRAEPHSH